MEDKMLLVNMAQCLNCKDVLISKDLHDLQTCSCGNLTIDGGTYSFKRSVKKRHSFKELSIYLPDSTMD